MAIPDHHSRNFQTLLRAAQDGNLALMECTDSVTGEPKYVLCAVGRDGEAYIMTPFGHLCEGDPYLAYGSRPSMWCKIGCGHWAAFSGGLGCNL
jgi:hypothetical protein